MYILAVLIAVLILALVFLLCWKVHLVNDVHTNQTTLAVWILRTPEAHQSDALPGRVARTRGMADGEIDGAK